MYYTHLSDKYAKQMTSENGWYTEEAGMAQFDDIVGSVLQKIDEMGIKDNTIVIITTDNGAEVISWPDGGMTPFAGEKGMATGRRYACTRDYPLAGQSSR